VLTSGIMSADAGTLKAEITALQEQKLSLSGAANKNKRKKLGTKIKKLEAALALLDIEDGPALPAATDAVEVSVQEHLCPAGHTLSLSTFAEGDYATGWHCDQCQAFGQSARWFCAECPYDLCEKCASSPPAVADEEAADEGDEDGDERADLLQQIAALEAEAADDATSDERRRAIEAEISAVKQTVDDLNMFDSLQDELDGLMNLKGKARVDARARIKEIQSTLDALEVSRDSLCRRCK